MPHDLCYFEILVESSSSTLDDNDDDDDAVNKQNALAFISFNYSTSTNFFSLFVQLDLMNLKSYLPFFRLWRRKNWCGSEIDLNRNCLTLAKFALCFLSLGVFCISLLFSFFLFILATERSDAMRCEAKRL